MNIESEEHLSQHSKLFIESFKNNFKRMFGWWSSGPNLTEEVIDSRCWNLFQPPGRKSNLNLMSVGKALSALALLFSIIRVKTIPFIYLGWGRGRTWRNKR